MLTLVETHKHVIIPRVHVTVMPGFIGTAKTEDAAYDRHHKNATHSNE